MITKGCSGGCDPHHIRRTKATTSSQNQTLNIGRYRPERTRLVSSQGSSRRSAIEPNIVSTPASFELIQRMSKVIARSIA
jgi:hypothetical protein